MRNGTHGHHHIAVKYACRLQGQIGIEHGHIAPFFNMPHRHPRLQKFTLKAKGAADQEVHQIVLPIGGNIRYFFHQLPCPPNAVLGKGGTHIVTAGHGTHLAAARLAHL